MNTELVCRLQNPAGESADPSRVRAALHHVRGAAGVPQQAPGAPLQARLRGQPLFLYVVAEVPEGAKLTVCVSSESRAGCCLLFVTRKHSSSRAASRPHAAPGPAGSVCAPGGGAGRSVAPVTQLRASSLWV